MLENLQVEIPGFPEIRGKGGDTYGYLGGRKSEGYQSDNFKRM
jgi:hypothetical protein